MSCQVVVVRDVIVPPAFGSVHHLDKFCSTTGEVGYIWESILLVSDKLLVGSSSLPAGADFFCDYSGVDGRDRTGGSDYRGK